MAQKESAQASIPTPSDVQLKDYAVIGDLYSAALVSPTGSIDWCCFPYLDCPSHFGALIHEKQGGYFHIFPQGEYRAIQSYVKNTQILETFFETPEGKGKILDWMPISQAFAHIPQVCRRVQVIEGKMTWILQCVPRFLYGAEAAQGEKIKQGVLFRNRRNEDILTLHGSVPLVIASNGAKAQAQFTLAATEVAEFEWSFGRESIFNNIRNTLSNAPRNSLKISSPFALTSLQSTQEYWENLAHRCPASGCIFGGPWHDVVTRSGLLVKLFVSPYSGSVAEAVTITLKGAAAGMRVWGNRYASLRDGSLMLQALVHLGYENEARLHFEWLKTILERDSAENLQSVYTLDGARISQDQEFHVFRGHEGIRQFQLDIYGHAISTVSTYFRIFRELPTELWPKLVEIADFICQVWKRPDHGPWGVNPRPEHFLVSKLFCWKALEQICWLAKETRQTPSPRWHTEQKILHQTICSQGFDEKQNSFIRSFGNTEVDVSCLWIPLLNFLPPEDFRVQGTLDLIRSELSRGVLLKQDREQDSSSGDLWSTLLFIISLSICGHPDEASDRLAELCTYTNPLGLFGDRIDSGRGETIQNFPSAAVHLCLINAALYVGSARLRTKAGIGLMGLGAGRGVDAKDLPKSA